MMQQLQLLSLEAEHVTALRSQVSDRDQYRTYRGLLINAPYFFIYTANNILLMRYWADVLHCCTVVLVDDATMKIAVYVAVFLDLSSEWNELQWKNRQVPRTSVLMHIGLNLALITCILREGIGIAARVSGSTLIIPRTCSGFVLITPGQRSLGDEWPKFSYFTSRLLPGITCLLGSPLVCRRDLARRNLTISVSR